MYKKLTLQEFIDEFKIAGVVDYFSNAALEIIYNRIKKSEENFGILYTVDTENIISDIVEESIDSISTDYPCLTEGLDIDESDQEILESFSKKFDVLGVTPNRTVVYAFKD